MGAFVVVTVLMNLYLLAVGLALISIGVRNNRMGIVNLGMLVVGALVMARFFDEHISFVLRGLVFIGLGIGFLATNYWLLTRKRVEK
jgi:hypothetical protein